VADSAAAPNIAQVDTERTFDRLVEEGEQRLGRAWPGLFATGALGGLDVGIGVLALLLVKHATNSEVLGGLAFAIGFIALSLARSELFTEDFLVPVAAVIAKQGTLLGLARLWTVTLVMNLAGGWVVTGLVIAGLPALRETAITSGAHYIHLGIHWSTLALAVVAGMLITLMTHLQHATESDLVRLVPAIVIGFLLGGGQLDHAIVSSLFCFAALQVGSPFGYAAWLGMLGLAIAGNMLGGLGLVTLLRMLQVPHKVLGERRDG
jgi:formate/nitrite transporter FocA (FNT family)